MRKLAETWRLIFRSLAVPTLLIASPMVLAKYWRAWSHFLQPLDLIAQCALVTAPVILVEAAASVLIAIVLYLGGARRKVVVDCADILTLLVLGFCASRLLDASFDHLDHPILLAAVVISIPVVWRLRSGKSIFEQYNRASEALIPIFLLGLVILVPGHVNWRRFDAVPIATSSPAEAYDKPDVILVTFDAMSAQDMSLFGYPLPTTPNFQRLARTSHVFSHFYSSSDFTTPAVVSLLTGKDLFSHRVYQLTGMVPAAIRSENLAHLLAADGWRTAAVVTNKYAHPLHLAIDRSFDYLPEPPVNWWLRLENWPLQIGHSLLFDSDASPTSWVIPFLRATGQYFPGYNENPPVQPGKVFDLSEHLIASASGPLFLWIHVFPPHFPYVTNPPFRGRFLAGDQYTTEADFERIRHVGHYHAAGQRLYELLRLRYDESIAQCDAALGSFLDWLSATGRRRNTLLVVTADHGESFHLWWGHESPDLNYPEVHIPLLISLPGESTGMWHHEDADLTDVAPTIARLLGIKPPSWMTGKPLLSAPSARPSGPAFAAYLARSYIFGAPQRGTVAAFSGDYQLVWYFPQGALRLFDVHRDPDGRNNIIKDYPAIAAWLIHAIRLRFGEKVPALRDGQK